MDEAGIYCDVLNRKYGKSLEGRRVRDEGYYSHGKKWSVIMAISGDNTGNRWLDCKLRSGTDIPMFGSFIRRIVNSIPPGNNQRRRCFIMDNLNVHRNPYIRQIVEGAGHRLIFRAPYYPMDGPIEYVFHTIEQALSIEFNYSHDNTNVRDMLRTTLMGIGSFEPYFVHCGY